MTRSINQSINQSINDEAVYRTAPATPDLLKIRVSLDFYDKIPQIENVEFDKM